MDLYWSAFLLVSPFMSLYLFPSYPSVVLRTCFHSSVKFLPSSMTTDMSPECWRSRALVFFNGISTWATLLRQQIQNEVTAHGDHST